MRIAFGGRGTAGRWPFVLFGLIGFVGGNLRLPAADPSPLVLQATDHVPPVTHLTATGASGPNLNLLGSYNLADWFLLQSASVDSGTARFAITNTEPVDHRFFRAIEAAAPAEVRIQAMPDESQSIGALLDPELGGVLKVTDTQGIQYQLEVPGGLLTEPQAITMTVVTNLTGLPFSNSHRAAVVFAPDGLGFRGAATLRIRFPDPIPTLKMVGYGFDGSGDNFHLAPWDPQTQEVTLAISHFSGAGVAAEPFPSVGNFNRNYDRARLSTRDAIWDADNWAGEEIREAAREHLEDAITTDQFRERLKTIKRLRNRKVYRNAIQPLLDAASRDCATGEIVLQRLDQLESETGQPYGTSEFFPESERLAPQVRCNCAHYYLERCEKDPLASGIGVTRGLDNVLDRVALMTGMVDDPNCDLGSNDAIDARLAKAKCHKAWEGTVRFSRIHTAGYTNVNVSGDTSLTAFSTERSDLTYVGKLATLTEEEGDVDPFDGSSWHAWTFQLAGKLNATHREANDSIYVEPDWTVNSTDHTQGTSSLDANGELILRFDNGKFSFASASAGLGDDHYEIDLRRTTEQTVDCRALLSFRCPEPVPPRTTQSTDNLYFASVPDAGEPGVVVTESPDQLKVVFTRTRVTRTEVPFPTFDETTETLTIQVFRGTAP